MTLERLDAYCAAMWWIVACAAILFGFLMGCWAKRPTIKRRCESLSEPVKVNGYNLGPDRCELEQDHSGPHMSTVPSCYDNGGQKNWWK